jgi:small GTP-binding protein
MSDLDNNNNTINNNSIIKSIDDKNKKNNNININNNLLNQSLSDFLRIKEFPKEIYKKKDTINIVFLGDKFVGKSCIVYQYINNKFEPFYIQTMYKEISKKIVSAENRKFNIEVSVTSGVPQYQEDYTDLYKTCDFFVVCYDVTSNDSLLKAKEIITKDLLPYIFLYEKGFSNIFLLGNKSDLKTKKIDNSKILEYTEKYKITFFETSAKNNYNISVVFNKIIDLYNQAIFPSLSKSGSLLSFFEK